MRQNETDIGDFNLTDERDRSNPTTVVPAHRAVFRWGTWMPRPC